MQKPKGRMTKEARSTKSENSNKSQEQRRLWLMFPPKLIKEPLIWKLGQKFPVITNIRQASITDELGIVSLELDGKRADIKAAIKWLEKMGVNVDPVEINVIES
jgi:ABC-type methionine transport system ATPase subunit